MEIQVSKQERRELKQKEREEEREKRGKQRLLRKAGGFIVAALIIGGGISGLWRYASSIPQALEGDILSKNGLHWHTQLSLFIDDKAQEIPADIGIGITHNPIHTHDATGEIHLEFSGLVKKSDLALGKFFEIWGKKFSLDGKMVKMTVNGKENTELESYIMKDKDVVEIRYQ